jgi:hypothetical protein
MVIETSKGVLQGTYIGDIDSYRGECCHGWRWLVGEDAV